MRGRPNDLNWKTRNRRGLPQMTRRMFAVLVLLRDAKAKGDPLLKLEGVNPITIRSMLGLIGNRDWLQAVEMPNGIYYRITGRGEKVLRTYETIVKRGDGLCPRCGKQPRRLRKTGIPAPYCSGCETVISAREYQLFGQRNNPDAPCSRCHKRPKKIYASGFVKDYCEHCLRIMRRGERKRKHTRRLRLIKQGKSPICLTKGCGEPIHYTAKTTYDYCHKHYFEMQKRCRTRRAAQVDRKQVI